MATDSVIVLDEDSNSSAGNLTALAGREVVLAIPALCFISLLMVVGAVGNLLVVLTYCRTVGKSSTHLVIFSLAALDLGSCCLVLPAELYHILHPLTNRLHYLCALQKFLSFALDLASGYIIVFISFDRYMRIARPHRGLSVCRAKLAVISICAVSFVLCSITLFIYGTEEVRTSPDAAILGYRCGITRTATQTALPLIFTTIVLALFGVAFVILLAVYTRLGVKVRKWNKDRNAKDCRQRSYFQAEESSSKLDHSPNEVNKQIETFTFPPLQNPDGRNTRAIIFKKPEFVRQISRSLDKYEFDKIDNVHSDGCKTLPYLKKQGNCTRSKRIVRRTSSRRSGIPSLTTLRKRITLSKTTVMFIAATVAFVLSHVPYVCVKVLHVTRPGHVAEMTSVQQSLYRFAEYSFIISYGVNPLIYSFMNPKFRRECYILLLGLAVAFRCRSRKLTLP